MFLAVSIRIAQAIGNFILGWWQFWSILATLGWSNGTTPLAEVLLATALASMIVPFVSLFLRGRWLWIQLIISIVLTTTAISSLGSYKYWNATRIAWTVFDVGVVVLNFLATRQRFERDLSKGFKLGICLLPFFIFGYLGFHLWSKSVKEQAISKLPDAAAVEIFVADKTAGLNSSEVETILSEYGMGSKGISQIPGGGTSLSTRYSFGRKRCYDVEVTVMEGQKNTVRALIAECGTPLGSSFDLP